MNSFGFLSLIHLGLFFFNVFIHHRSEKREKAKEKRNQTQDNNNKTDEEKRKEKARRKAIYKQNDKTRQRNSCKTNQKYIFRLITTVRETKSMLLKDYE